MLNICIYWLRLIGGFMIENWELVNLNYWCLKFIVFFINEFKILCGLFMKFIIYFLLEFKVYFEFIINFVLIFLLYCSKRSFENSDKVRNRFSIMFNVFYLYIILCKIILLFFIDFVSIYCVLYFIEIKKCRWYV